MAGVVSTNYFEIPTIPSRNLLQSRPITFVLRLSFPLQEVCQLELLNPRAGADLTWPSTLPTPSLSVSASLSSLLERDLTHTGFSLSLSFITLQNSLEW
jgi:hypothetical protein